MLRSLTNPTPSTPSSLTARRYPRQTALHSILVPISSRSPVCLRMTVAGPPPHMSSKTFKQIAPAVANNWVYVYDLQANEYVEVIITVVEARPVGKAAEAVTVRH